MGDGIGGFVFGTMCSILVTLFILDDEVNYLDIVVLNGAISKCPTGYVRLQVTANINGYHKSTEVACEDGSTVILKH